MTILWTVLDFIEAINSAESACSAIKAFEKECYSLQFELVIEKQELTERNKSNKSQLGTNVELIAALKKRIDEEQKKQDQLGM